MIKFAINKRSLITHVLVLIFGSASWMSINGTWMELPLLVTVLPERWKLSSYLAITTQIAIIGPLVHWLCSKVIGSGFWKRQSCDGGLWRAFSSCNLIYFFLGLTAVSHFVLAFVWDRTSIWFDGKSHSTAYLIMYLPLALANCMSNVLYLPYMYRFRPGYTTAYFIGMGFSALLPSVLGLIQGTNAIECVPTVVNSSTNETEVVPYRKPALFGVDVFSVLLGVWMLVAFCSFFLLNRWRYLNAEREASEALPATTAAEVIRNDDLEERRRLSTGDTPAGNPPEAPRSNISAVMYFYYLGLTFWASALMNGVLPSIQSFACMPYGIMTYHLSVALSNLINPVACFVPFFIRVRRVPLCVGVGSVLATAVSAYIVVLAANSPHPVLGNSAGSVGPAFCVIAAILSVGLLAYLRTVMASALRESGGDSENRLYWCGFATQAGAFIGAVAMFPLVNVYELFKDAPNCVV